MNICVFCSSSNAVDDVYFSEADQLAKLIINGRHNLIYGGANVGLMDALAVKVLMGNRDVIGIIPQKIFDKELAAKHVSELIVTDTMDKRKSLMRDKSDAFIALPGGFGTLEEILEVLTLKQLDYHRKPVIFINTNGFFDDLFNQFEKSYDEMFARENYRKMYYVANSAAEAFDYLNGYAHIDLGTKWFDVPSK